MKNAIAKGVFDILPHDPSPEGVWRSSHLWQYVEGHIRSLAQAYGYREIRTPLFEATDLFVRGVGDSSDIVTKEMYTFEDRAGRSMTLRPEGTAPVMRSIIEKRLDQQPFCQKLFYIGPMFRYERPQAGRYRQHHQFGVEAIGDPSPEQDVEVIDLLCELYNKLGMKNLTVMINSVGDVPTREAYGQALRAFLTPFFDQLSPESQARFEKNVLRILDSKDPKDQSLLQKAPSILDFLSEEAKDHFAQLQTLLRKLGRTFKIEHRLVRGLDYYTKTVFEITSGELGSQNTVGGGGRYDGLSAILGGPPLPAVGFATGIERIIQTCLAQQVPLPKMPHPVLFVIPLGERAQDHALTLTYELRHQNVATEVQWKAKKMGASLQKASQLGAVYALVLGDQELDSGQVTLKELATRKEIALSLSDVTPFLLGLNS